MSNTSSKKIELPLRIGITGGIGSGKTLICSIFKVLGIPVFEADSVAKSLYNTDPELKESLIKLFGAGIYQPGGIINRPLLASIIFNEKVALSKLNEIVHPKVRQAFEVWHSKQDAPYVLHEAAILFESGFYRFMDANILVMAHVERRIERVIKRDRLTRETIAQRMENQWSDEKKMGLANYIIYNNEEDFLINQVMETDKKLREYGKIC